MTHAEQELAEPMPVAMDEVRELFTAVLAKEADTLARIDAYGAELEIGPEGFVFSLPALHGLLDPGCRIEYREFRKLLYASTLNEELAAYDAEVILQYSSGKIDSSRYCLRHRINPC